MSASTHSGQRTLVVLAAASALMMVGVGMTVVLLPQRVHDQTGSLESVGLVAAVFAVTYLLAQLPAGVLADRFGAAPLLVAGYGFCALAGLVYTLSPTAAGIYLGRAVHGIGEAPVWALGPAVLALAYPAAKGRAIGIYNAAIHAGLTAGPLIGLLVDPTGRSVTPFILFSLSCIAGAAIVALFLPRPKAAAAALPVGAALRGALALFLHGPSLVVLAGIVLYGASYGAFLSVLPVTAVTQKGFTPQSVSVFFAVFYAAISVSQLVAGPLSDRYGRTSFMAGGLLLALAGLALFLLLPAGWSFAMLAASSFGLGTFCVASLARLADTAPAQLKNTVSSGYYFAWALGYVAGPLAIGALEPAGHGLGYGALAVLMAAQVAALLAYRERRR